MELPGLCTMRNQQILCGTCSREPRRKTRARQGKEGLAFVLKGVDTYLCRGGLWMSTSAGWMLGAWDGLTTNMSRAGLGPLAVARIRITGRASQWTGSRNPQVSVQRKRHFAHRVAQKASDPGSVHEASWWQVAISGFRQGGARCASFYSIRFRPRGSRQTAIVIAAFTLILTFVFFVSVPLVSELFVCCSFRLCSA